VRSLDDFVGPALLSATTIAAHIAALAPSVSAMPSVPAMPAVRAEDAAIVIYTSGTTGFPKGVVHSHRNYVLAAEAFVARLNLQPQERLLTVLPFFHINALFYSLGGAIATGGTVITTARFSATDFWHLAARSRATQFNILASIGNILGQRSRSEFNNAHRIRKIYGGPISAETFRWFEDDFHIPLLIEGFGMSEIPGACCNPYAGPHKFGSIGKPAVHPRFPGRFVEMRIEDEQGFVLPTGQIGELVVKTPMLFSQYLDDPAQTAAAFRDGWFLTGDLARVDDDGYFYYVARKKDIIRRRGENIAGAELDRVLSSHPSVIEAATIGVPAELGDEEILAAVIVKPGQTLQAEELAAWCADKLAAMKIPRYIVFVDALPHTPSHRVAKHRLKSNPDLLRSAYDRQAPLNGK
jgi:carnitine-CoA ligase